MSRLVAAGSTQRWRAAIALAGYAGLRIGEIRALTWTSVDLDANTITVTRSALRDGTMKAPKTAAGKRVVPMLPIVRRALVAWNVRSPKVTDHDLVICTATGDPVQEGNFRRALEAAKKKAKITAEAGERLSWHSLRHSSASLLATDLELPATTLARSMGTQMQGSPSAYTHAMHETTPP